MLPLTLRNPHATRAGHVLDVEPGPVRRLSVTVDRFGRAVPADNDGEE